jgi:type I restriction enzyme S subunit
MTAEQLKNSILQEAISGRLVPQDPNDEPASVLLLRIRGEKARLVKEGKLKKKDLVETPITEDEKPFEIPASWEWCRVQQVIKVKSGDGLNVRSLNDKAQYPVYGGNGINGTYHQYNVEADTLVIGRVGFYCGAVHKTYGKAWVTDNALIVSFVKTGIFVDFLKYVLTWLKIRRTSNSTAQPVVSGKGIYPLIFPLPPLAEQKRIVAKLEELLPIVEQYGKAQQELDELNTALPARLRQSILQEAIQGKLVPQDENDEPASVLLLRIREEKARLVKAKQISKRDFEVLPITEDDVDFDIPVTWEWVRLGDIFKHSTGKALNEANKKGCLHDYITTSNVYWGYFKLEKLRQMYYTEDEKEKCMATKGDLLVLEGGDVGRAAIWDKDYDIFLQNHIHKLRAYVPVCTEFYYYCLYLFHDMGLIGGKGIGIQGLSSGALHQIVFPLPPLAEQKRIVAKIEELFEQIEKISK